MTNKAVEDAVKAAFAANPDNPVLAMTAASQAVLESGLQKGTPSGLAGNYNNYFGIKGTGSAGSVALPTREAWGQIVDNFRVYNTATESFADHRRLMGKDRYTGVLNASSVEEAAVALQRAGYATDTQYAQKVISTYERYVKPVIDANPEIAREAAALMKLSESKAAQHKVVRAFLTASPEQAQAIINGSGGVGADGFHEAIAYLGTKAGVDEKALVEAGVDVAAYKAERGYVSDEARKALPKGAEEEGLKSGKYMKRGEQLIDLGQVKVGEQTQKAIGVTKAKLEQLRKEKPEQYAELMKSLEKDFAEQKEQEERRLRSRAGAMAANGGGGGAGGMGGVDSLEGLLMIAIMGVLSAYMGQGQIGDAARNVVKGTDVQGPATPAATPSVPKAAAGVGV